MGSGYRGPVAMFASMLKRDRERNGLRIARASWLVGVRVREYRELEAGTKSPDCDTYERVCELCGRPRWLREGCSPGEGFQRG